MEHLVQLFSFIRYKIMSALLQLNKLYFYGSFSAVLDEMVWLLEHICFTQSESILRKMQAFKDSL